MISRTLFLSGCITAGVITGPSAPGVTMSRQRALLIGISDYQPLQTREQHVPATDLSLLGAVNDAEAMRAVLTSARWGFSPEDITMLERPGTRGKEPTRERILAELRRLIDRSASGDVLLFYFAGFGSQTRNSRSAERDQLDETIVTVPSVPGRSMIRDKELDRLFRQAVHQGVRLTAVFDCCHCGSIARGIPVRHRYRYLAPSVTDARDPGEPGPPAEEQGALILSATQDFGVAAELPDDRGIWHGVFTRALLDVMAAVDPREAAHLLYQRVQARVWATGLRQLPVLAGTEERRVHPLLGTGHTSYSGTVVSVTQVGQDGVELNHGLNALIQEGCELVRIRAVGNAVRLRVTRPAQLDHCHAVLIEGSLREVHPGDLFVVARWVAPEEPLLRVGIPPPLADATIRRIARSMQSLCARAGVRWVEDPTQDTPESRAPLHIMRWQGSEWQLTTPEGATISLGHDPQAAMVGAQLKRSADHRCRLFLDLPPSVQLRRQLQIGPGTPLDAIAIAPTPEQAHYLLVGRWRKNQLEYAWVAPEASERSGSRRTGPASAGVDGSLNGGQQSPLPVRSKWLPIGQTQAEVNGHARGLEDRALRCGRIRAWLALQSPPDDGRFPYELAIRDTRSGKLISEGFLHHDGTFPYLPVLRRDRRLESSGYPLESRYVYLFTINRDGTGKLIFPRFEYGGVENYLPPKNSPLPEEAPLGNTRFDVAAPYGVETYILLTTTQPLSDPSVLSFDGPLRHVLPRQGALARLLAHVGGGVRSSPGPVPTDWSIQHLVLESLPPAMSWPIAVSAPGTHTLAKGRESPSAPSGQILYDPGTPEPEAEYDPTQDQTVIPIHRDPELTAAVIRLAKQSEGIREVPPGSNRGLEVERYLAFCGVKAPNKWCAAYVSYQIHQAAQRLQRSSSWPRFANCTDIYHWARKHRLFLQTPQPGCVFLVPRGDGTYRHAGFVIEVHPDGSLVTIEGNANNNGSSEGIGVFKLKRKQEQQGVHLVYIRIV